MMPRYRFSHPLSLTLLLLGAAAILLAVAATIRFDPQLRAKARPAPTPQTTQINASFATASEAFTLAGYQIDRSQPARIMSQQTPGLNGHPTLADLWHGTAHFVRDVVDTGLPMGESDTVLMSNGELWSYFHGSAQSAGVVDQCGAEVPFPGCTLLYRSTDAGRSFAGEQVCHFSCQQCPCSSEVDHIEQQQYPDLFVNDNEMLLVYEYLGRTMLRRSLDGLNWSAPDRIAQTGIWYEWFASCPSAETIGQHPFVPYNYECLSGAPPGIFVVDNLVYVFVAVGQNPGGLGCYVGTLQTPPEAFERCANNPLLTGVNSYGPTGVNGAEANRYYDFRTISSAEIQAIPSPAGPIYYMLYEGIRGPGPGDNGDTQFALGMARSTSSAIDGPWERYPGNPLLVDLPGNVGLGHADLVVVEGQTVLFTSLDGKTRSRLLLVWKNP